MKYPMYVHRYLSDLFKEGSPNFCCPREGETVITKREHLCFEMIDGKMIHKPMADIRKGTIFVFRGLSWVKAGAA